MEYLKNLKAILKVFEEERKNKNLSDPQNREEYAKAIAECFEPCAKEILAGRFRVTYKAKGKDMVRFIYPTTIELYYHEEGDGRFKDPIMYHTNDRKRYDFYKNNEFFEKHYKDKEIDMEKEFVKRKYYFAVRNNLITEIPYFPFGSLNPHQSGIDITFENPEEKYRASCLIREYDIQFGEKGRRIPIPNSTDIYDDMLVNGIALDSSNYIEWENVKSDILKLEKSKRTNVCEYEKYNDKPELWQKKVKKEGDFIVTDSKGKPKYEECKFSWRFSIKK